MTNVNKEIEEVVEKIAKRMARGSDDSRTIGTGTHLNPLDKRILKEECVILFTSIAQKAREEERERLEKVIENKRYTNEQIKDIGKSWIGHPCQGYNQAIEDVLHSLKNN